MSKKPLYERLDMSLSPRQRVQAIQKDFIDDLAYQGWDAEAVRALKIISVDYGRIEHEIEISAAFCNKQGNASGGFITTILDITTSMVMLTISKEGFMDGGSLTRSISCTYLKALPEGTRVRIISKVVTGGRKLSYAAGEIQTMDGIVAVSFAQDKVELPRAKM